MKWLLLRLAAIISSISGIVFFQHDTMGIGWGACCLISITTLAGLVLFFFILSKRSESFPLSLSWHVPFYPSQKYPVQFWLISSISMILGGITSMIMDAIKNNGLEAFGGTFLGMGIAGLIATFVGFRCLAKRGQSEIR